MLIYINLYLGTNKQIFYRIASDGSRPVKCFQGLKFDDLAECESVYCATPCYPEQSPSLVLESYSQCIEDCKDGDTVITNPLLDPHIYWDASYIIYSNLDLGNGNFIFETVENEYRYGYTRYQQSKGDIMYVIRVLELGG